MTVPPAPKTRQVAAGEDLCLECEVAEAGEVVWLKGTERIQPSGRVQVLCQGQRQMLLIRGFSPEDQGEYCCSPARDSASVAATSFQGMSPRAQYARLGEPWWMEWTSPLPHWLSVWEPQKVLLRSPFLTPRKTEAGVGRCTTLVCLSLLSEPVSLAFEAMLLPEWDPGQCNTWYPLLFP